jgi:hypothetical protein
MSCGLAFKSAAPEHDGEVEAFASTSKSTRFDTGAGAVGSSREGRGRKEEKNTEDTDKGTLHRATSKRRRDKTLPILDAFVKLAGPVHLPQVTPPAVSDTKAYNDYKAQVCACVCACARARAAHLLMRSGRR